MILANINIGTGPSAGDGDPLRTAFTTINNNFQIVTNNVNALTNSVTSVAGRTGNVILTVNDIVGLTNGTKVINRYVSTVNGALANAVVISTSSTLVFLAPLASGSASYTIGNGVSDGQTITFLPSWKTGTNANDVQNIFVFSNRLYSPTGTNGRYSTTSYPWYPFTYFQSNPQKSSATLTWDSVGQYWVPDPFNYD
jgi:hypothetical protein